MTMELMKPSSTSTMDFSVKLSRDRYLVGGKALKTQAILSYIPTLVPR